MAFLMQLAGSAGAVTALVGLAAWLGVPRSAPPLDEAEARRLLAEEFPETRVVRVWTASDGRSALARAGDEALIVYRAGDGYVIRSAPWSRVKAAGVSKGRVVLALNDAAAPRVSFTVNDGAAWPPKELAA